MNISVFNFILSFAVALVLHELGHFLAARACRVPVTGAGFGWGPKLLDFELGKLIISFVHYQSALTSEWTCQLCRDDRCINNCSSCSQVSQ